MIGLEISNEIFMFFLTMVPHFISKGRYLQKYGSVHLKLSEIMTCPKTSRIREYIMKTHRLPDNSDEVFMALKLYFFV